MAKSKNITTMQLALITAAAVISLRGLPMMAQEELTMFFYIFFADLSVPHSRRTGRSRTGQRIRLPRAEASTPG